MKFCWHNQSKKKIKQLQESLPQGLILQKKIDVSEELSDKLRDIRNRIISTLCVLFLILYLLIRSFRHLIVYLLVFIANLMYTGMVLRWLNIELHQYTLLGITVSLSLIIDYYIVMTDHYQKFGNRKVFLALLASTLTTFAALISLFFAEESIQNNMFGFAIALIVQLSIALIICLFVLPALLDFFWQKEKHSNSLNTNKPVSQREARTKKYLGGAYQHAVKFLVKYRIFIIVVLLLAFGLPVFNLPRTIESESDIAKIYNSSLGTQTYRESIKPHVDKYLGGVLRLFFDRLNKGNDPTQDFNIYISGQLPLGSEPEQANKIAQRLEKHLGKLKQVEIFKTNISSAGKINLEISLLKEYRTFETGVEIFYFLTKIIRKIGSVDWNIRFLEENESYLGGKRQIMQNYMIKLYGYNFTKLFYLAQNIKKDLLRSTLINLVSVRGGYKKSQISHQASINKKLMATNKLSPGNISDMMSAFHSEKDLLGEFYINGKLNKIEILDEHDATNNSQWMLEHKPIEEENLIVKFGNLLKLGTTVTETEIHRENGKYTLTLAFDYQDYTKPAIIFTELYTKKLNHELPIGYTAKIPTFYQAVIDETSAWQLLLIVIVVFFICSILFESFLQALAVILIIPVSFIGSFWFFELFDVVPEYGTFTSLLLTAGLSVNAAIFIINDYNNNKYQSENSFHVFLLAFKAKIKAIVLTVLSTILGLLPFMIGETDLFWYNLTIGTMGGLLFSLLGIVFYLPIVMVKKKHFLVEQVR